MTTSAQVTRTLRSLADVLHDARALPRQERARLIGLLADDLAEPPAGTLIEPSPSAAALRAAWDRVDTFAETFRADFPDADVSAQIATDRRERDDVLAAGEHDVHS